MGGPHSRQCVERFTRLLGETDEGQRRIQQVKDKLDHFTAKLGPGVQPAGDAIPTQFEELDESQRFAGVEGVQGGRGLPADEAVRAETPADQGGISGATTPRADDPDQERDDDMWEEPHEADIGMDEDSSLLEPLLSVCTEDVKEDVECFEVEILRLINELGCGSKSYRRERKSRLKAIVSELYSPPRVTKAAKLLPSMGISPGLALDVTTVNDKGEPWDFDDESKQQEALDLVEETQPWILIGSPMCTAFCTWQYLNAHKRDPALVAAERAKAVRQHEFVCKLYKRQV